VRKTLYHRHLVLDKERVAAFKEAIQKKAHGIVYDLGAGSGVLSYLASDYADFVYAIEKDTQIIEKARTNLESVKNIEIINQDVTRFIFPVKADVIICEMLDTALIDEEQVPVINSILKYLKKDAEIIPKGILNGIEAISIEANHICYEEDGMPLNTILSKLKIYYEYDFKIKMKEEVNVDIILNINKKGIMSGVKITTFALLTSDIICGPTQMFNPPLIVPTERIEVESNDNVKINLRYEMGGGLDTIKTKIEKVPRKS
jgi:predicted RNA methylase